LIFLPFTFDNGLYLKIHHQRLPSHASLSRIILLAGDLLTIKFSTRLTLP